ncbi:MAG: YlbF family regulator [Eubacterium sp.]|jgi:cell fate (sporulation/competence/biofilm development) regulator YlbF (YheA/YmcA/DUF963 family)|nr:YlbF family regulator [Eubacterium sp.]
MDELKGELRQVNRLIKDSQEYKSYIFAKNALKMKDELYRAVIEFKKRYADIERYTEGNPYDELYKLYVEYDELIHDSTVNEYLRAESAFSELIRMVTDEVFRGFSFE